MRAGQQLGSIAGGLVGGVISTAVMQKGMAASGRLPEVIRPPYLRQDPGDYVVEQIEQQRGRALSPTAHRRIARGLHWLYGIGWSTALSAIAPRLGMHRLGRALTLGAALGAGVWAVGFLGWLPRSGLVARPRKQGATHHASAIASHIGYGLLAAVPIWLANRAFVNHRR